MDHQPITATLSFSTAPDVADDVLRVELLALFNDVGLDLHATPDQASGLGFQNKTMLARVVRDNSTFTVSVEQSSGNPPPARAKRAEQARRATCYNIVRALQTRLSPTSVTWADPDMAAADAASQEQAARAGIRQAVKTPRPDHQGTADRPAAARTLDATQLMDQQSQNQLDQSFLAAQFCEPDAAAGTSPSATSKALDLTHFPELMPVEQALREQRRAVFPSDTIALTKTSAQDEATDPAQRHESNDLTARLTVYVMNTILLVLAFPVGFGMLIFNILGGENLRTTAHVMALTGMGMALAGANIDLPLLSLL